MSNLIIFMVGVNLFAILVGLYIFVRRPKKKKGNVIDIYSYLDIDEETYNDHPNPWRQTK